MKCRADDWSSKTWRIFFPDEYFPSTKKDRENGFPDPEKPSHSEIVRKSVGC